MKKTLPPNASTRGKLKIILLGILFASPVILASVLYSLNWRPKSFVNYGQLVQPARPIQDVSLTTLDGKTIEFSQLRKKWTMLYFGSSDCEATCQQVLYKMQWTQVTQGQESDRIARVFMVTDGNNTTLSRLHDVLMKYPDMRILTASPQNLQTLARQFTLPTDDNTPTAASYLTRIYIVDPNGNLMMSYPLDADAKGMSKDFNRLLRVSHIG